MELAKHVRQYGEMCPGLEQYAIQRFALAFHALPKALAENAGVKSNEVQLKNKCFAKHECCSLCEAVLSFQLISKLQAAHNEGEKNAGFDIMSELAKSCDAVERGILDLYITKHWAIKFATAAVCTVLKVDQIIMAKQAGGPKAKDNKNWDDDD